MSLDAARYLLARMTHDMLPERALPAEARQDRAKAARSWLASLSLPAGIRTAFVELAAATAGDLAGAAPVLRRVIEVTALTLGADARSELERLATQVESQPIATA